MALVVNENYTVDTNERAKSTNFKLSILSNLSANAESRFLENNARQRTSNYPLQKNQREVCILGKSTKRLPLTMYPIPRRRRHIQAHLCEQEN